MNTIDQSKVSIEEQEYILSKQQLFLSNQTTASNIISCLVLSFDIYYKYIEEEKKKLKEGSQPVLYERLFSVYLSALNEKILHFQSKENEVNNEKREVLTKLVEEGFEFIINFGSILNFLVFDDIKSFTFIMNFLLRENYYVLIEIFSKERILSNVSLLSNSLLKNFEYIRIESIVFEIGEIYRSLFSINEIYSFLLTYSFFNSIYKLCACDKFIVSNEMFHLLFYMIESEKVDKNIFKNFFLSNSTSLMKSLISTLNYFIGLDEIYLVERDTLVFFKKLILNQEYASFRRLFLNDAYNLKVVLIQLNNDCQKIRIEALHLLHEFFIDIDSLSEMVLMLILDNKDNFYLLFELNSDIFNTEAIEEKKDFILYQLERIMSMMEQ